MRKIRKVSSLSSLSEIPKPGEREAVRVSISPIPIAPGSRMLDRESDQEKLEKAAMPQPIGTLPERIIWKWLEDNDMDYRFQLAELGGRETIGGAVVDFVVYNWAGRPIALRVQGTYWHGPQFPETQAKDDEQAQRLRMIGFAVADAWEHDIYAAVLNERLHGYMQDLLDNAV